MSVLPGKENRNGSEQPCSNQTLECVQIHRVQNNSNPPVPACAKVVRTHSSPTSSAIRRTSGMISTIPTIRATGPRRRQGPVQQTIHGKLHLRRRCKRGHIQRATSSRADVPKWYVVCKHIMLERLSLNWINRTADDKTHASKYPATT